MIRRIGMLTDRAVILANAPLQVIQALRPAPGYGSRSCPESAAKL